MKLDGNTILLTGGASGIGLALATALQKRGNTVIITGRDQAKLDKAKQAVPELHVIQSDVARVADIDALFAKVTEEFPKLNVLINNAGVMRTINLNKHDGSLEDLTSEIDINLSGPIRMVRRFLPQLAKQDSAASATPAISRPNTTSATISSSSVNPLWRLIWWVPADGSAASAAFRQSSRSEQYHKATTDRRSAAW